MAVDRGLHETSSLRIIDTINFKTGTLDRIPIALVLTRLDLLLAPIK